MDPGTYFVSIEATAFVDTSGNAYEGGHTANFVVEAEEADITAPTLVSSNANGSAAWALGDAITLTFSENVVVNDGSNGHPGDIRLEYNDNQQYRFDHDNGSTGETWGGDLTGWGTDTLTFVPGEDLEPNQTYSFTIPDGFITDVAGNPFPGLTRNDNPKAVEFVSADPP